MLGITGTQRVLVRRGFSESDAFGNGLVCATYGPLDAPDLMHQGSMRSATTIKPSVWPSMGHRDGDARRLGEPHDGPESAQIDWAFALKQAA